MTGCGAVTGVCVLESPVGRGATVSADANWSARGAGFDGAIVFASVIAGWNSGVAARGAASVPLFQGCSEIMIHAGVRAVPVTKLVR